ncbi:nucleotidyltransferase domain-containing protein [Paenibacillus filicis]|uniref:Nucleotidyltransferase domain-containing protein n=1 Tax=Paenibacillus filicis TaxID=669464 RepID=A0ABU9DVA9_9BACL
MRYSAHEAAARFIETYFPHCEGAVWAGSAAHGEATEDSDVDLVIFDEAQETPFRRTYRDFGWVIEAFVLNRESYRYFFDVAIDSAVPSLLRMCAFGIPLCGQSEIRSILEEARQDFTAGPPAWGTYELTRARYELSELAADLSGARDRQEGWFVAAELAQRLAVFKLRVNRCWIGEGKWLIRELTEYDPAAGRGLVAALEAYYLQHNCVELLTLTDAWLAPYGGRLDEGYFEGNE